MDNPAELSLAELRVLPAKTQITLHHSIQGWSGIGAWTALPLEDLI